MLSTQATSLKDDNEIHFCHCGGLRPYNELQSTDFYSATNRVCLTDVVIDQVIPTLARPILVYNCCLRVRSSA
jgi:hypothetical protein